MLDIIYEDESLIVCYKPSNTPVQSRKLHIPDMEQQLKSYLLRTSGNPGCFLAVVHRLDQPVEGVIVFAKTKESAAVLSGQLQNHTMEKEYLAVVEGRFEREQDRLEDYLKKDGKRNCSFVVEKNDPEGKLSILEYQVLETKESMQLLKIRLHTGRHHQIRLQLSHAGHPIAGDTKYGADRTLVRDGTRIGLCAHQLTFQHPKTGKKMVFTCKPRGKFFQEFI